MNKLRELSNLELGMMHAALGLAESSLLTEASASKNSRLPWMASHFHTLKLEVQLELEHRGEEVYGVTYEKPKTG